jgi:hypothetical protein
MAYGTGICLSFFYSLDKNCNLVEVKDPDDCFFTGWAWKVGSQFLVCWFRHLVDCSRLSTSALYFGS